MKAEFYVIRMRVPKAVHWLYYADTVGYPGSCVPFERATRYPDVAATAPVMELHTKAGDVAFVHPAEKIGDEVMLGESVADNLPAPTRELLRTKGPEHYIIALAESFPALRGKIEGCGITAENFDVNRLVDYSGPWSTYERTCVMFVVNVWNPGYAESQGWKFDLFDTINGWDKKNRTAFLAWCQSPVLP